MDSKSIFALLLVLACVVMASAFTLEIHALSSSTKDTYFPIYGVMELSAEESLSKEDKFSLTLTEAFPHDAQLKIQVIGGIAGHNLATWVGHIPKGTKKVDPSLLDWSSNPVKGGKVLFYGALDFGKEVVSQIESSITITYTLPAESQASTAALHVFAPFSTMARFNATCETEDCADSLYTTSIQDIQADLTELQFVLVGATQLVTDEAKTHLSCHINNIAVTATVVTKGVSELPYYSFVHEFKKGYDYVIFCPESILIDPYPEQSWSVVEFVGIGKDKKKYSGRHLFALGHDTYFPALYSSGPSIGRADPDQIFATFTIAPAPEIDRFDEVTLGAADVPSKANVQFEFTGATISSVIAYAITGPDNTRTLITKDPIKPNDGHEFPYVDFTQIIKSSQRKNIHVVVVAQVDPKHKLDADLIQARMELQYAAVAPKPDPVEMMADTELLTTVVIADIARLPSLVDKQVVVKKVSEATTIPVDYAFKALPSKAAADTKATFTLRLPSPDLQFVTVKDEKLTVSCTWGDIALPAVEVKTAYGLQSNLVWTDVDISKVKAGTFKCDKNLRWTADAPANVVVSVAYSNEAKETVRAVANITYAKESLSRTNYVFIAAIAGGIAVIALIVIAVVCIRKKKRNVQPTLLGEDGNYDRLQ